MKINNTNLNFTGIWRKNVQSSKNPADYKVNNVYLETITYHPFKDEVVSDEIKGKESLKGFKYYEFDKNNFGRGVESSLAVQKVEMGEDLGITKAEYDELVKIKQAGEIAAEKLKALGSIEMYSLGLPTSKSRNATMDETDATKQAIDKILDEFSE